MSEGAHLANRGSDGQPGVQAGEPDRAGRSGQSSRAGGGKPSVGSDAGPHHERAICVYCSSSRDVAPRFFHAARTLGQLIGQRGDVFVYGGGSIGLMGEIARSVHRHGGRVVGVIPEPMREVEVAYEQADELVITDNMRQRKQAMEDRADVFLAMPGGFGTLEELTEILTARRLGFHDKPIVIVNVDGFYDPLLAFFDELIEMKFASPRYREHFCIAANVEDAMRQAETLTQETARQAQSPQTKASESLR